MNRAFKAKTETMSKGSIIAVLALSLLVFIGGDIEGIYISTLFGLRLVVILRLPARYYLPAALLEAAMVSINPGYGIYNFLDHIAYQAHLVGIATTYLSAWFWSAISNPPQVSVRLFSPAMCCSSARYRRPPSPPCWCSGISATRGISSI